MSTVYYNKNNILLFEVQSLEFEISLESSFYI